VFDPSSLLDRKYHFPSRSTHIDNYLTHNDAFHDFHHYLVQGPIEQEVFSLDSRYCDYLHAMRIAFSTRPRSAFPIPCSLRLQVDQNFRKEFTSNFSQCTC
ncbi:hypothetical protein PENTCL1PPCAC_14725, partial [Pristionchus entomophagus]